MCTEVKLHYGFEKKGKAQLWKEFCVKKASIYKYIYPMYLYIQYVYIMLLYVYGQDK